jgi:hypothetical protein
MNLDGLPLLIMKKTFLGRSQKLLIFILGTLSSCIQSGGIPKDLYIRISGTPSQPGAGGGHTLTLTSKSEKTNGRIFEWSLSLDNQVQRMELPDSVVQKIVNELRRGRVFSLRSRYADYNILDGGTDVLTVRMNGREKIIQMDNESPEELTEFFRLIYRPQ